MSEKMEAFDLNSFTDHFFSSWLLLLYSQVLISLCSYIRLFVFPFSVLFFIAGLLLYSRFIFIAYWVLCRIMTLGWGAHGKVVVRVLSAFQVVLSASMNASWYRGKLLFARLSQVSQQFKLLCSVERWSPRFWAVYMALIYILCVCFMWCA